MKYSLTIMFITFISFAKMDSGTVDEGLAGMSAEQMESKMIDFIHGDFMKLLSNLQYVHQPIVFCI